MPSREVWPGKAADARTTNAKLILCNPQVENYVLVIHGVTISCFLMRFFKYSVDEFNSYKNFGNCEFAVLERNESGWLEFSHCVLNKAGVPEIRAERAREPEEEQQRREMRYI